MEMKNKWQKSKKIVEKGTEIYKKNSEKGKK